VIINSLRKLEKGSCFGEESFFTAFRRFYSVRSIDFTTLLMIKRKDFIELLKQYPEDYEKYCQLRDNIIFKSNFEDLGL